MNIVGVIPARMDSTRFPNKPMADILGMPMIGHVYFRSKMCASFSDVWVATCDAEISDYIESVGGRAVMTASSHQRASDRTGEALLKIEQITGIRIDYAAMIQGDEPMLVPGMLDALVKPIAVGEAVEVVNLIAKIESWEEFLDPNTVKVVLGLHDNILYFSREPIPSTKKFKGIVPMWKQLGLILFRRESLLKYIGLTPTPLEIIESVDMNRFLEHGIDIKAGRTSHRTSSIDTPEDLIRVRHMLALDPLVKTYLR